MSSHQLNQLYDFDLCLSVTENAINTQMQTAWKSWKVRHNWESSITIRLEEKINQPRVLQIANSLWLKKDRRVPYLVADFSPMEVSFDNPLAKQGKVKVKLTMDSGTAFYLKPGEKDLTGEAFENWSFYFFADLDKEPVNKETLKAIDPKALDEVNDLLKYAHETEKIKDSFFSIEYLFMKFNMGDSQSIDPANVSAGAKDVVINAITRLIQNSLQSKLMFGTVVRRTNASSAPTFALNDFMFNVHPGPGVNTLDYLGVFTNNKLPHDTAYERSRITLPFLNKDRTTGVTQLLAGALIISKRSFFDNYLMPHIKKTLSQRAPHVKESVTDSRNFGYVNINSNVLSDTAAAFKFTFENTLSWTINFKIDTENNCILITGQVTSKLHFDFFVRLFNERIGYYHVAGYRNITGKLTMNGHTPVDSNRQPEPEKFKIDLNVNIELGNIVETENDSSGMLTISGALEGVFKKIGIINGTTQEKLNGHQKDAVKLISEDLKNALDALDIHLKNHAFIPPGGGVFSYQNPHFSNHADLYIDALYHIA